MTEVAPSPLDYTALLSLGPDTTECRLVTTAEAMRDIAHFLRTGHLRQLIAGGEPWTQEQLTTDKVFVRLSTDLRSVH